MGWIPLGSSPGGCSAGRGPTGIGLPARFRGSSTGLRGRVGAAQGGVRIFPEKSSADGAESVVGPETPFAEFLRRLYEAAGGGTDALRLRKLVKHADDCGLELAEGRFSDWFNGQTVPRKENGYYVRDKLIPWLEEQAEKRTPGYQRRPPATWQARLDAAQARSKSGQGGRGPRVDAASRGILLRGASQTLTDVFPLDFVGREEELAELEAFAAAPDGAPQYLWLQAGPWAGKTALLAWFAAQRLPAGVDAAHYFIVGRLGTNVREGFVRVVGEQLASAAGLRRPPAVDPEAPDLGPLYEAAAGARAKRRRHLLLIVDGLDEDADADQKGYGIAGLLPKHPPRNMRVIVAGRHHPHVPLDLVSDHPLRSPGVVVRRLTDSPAARIIRDSAMQELTALVKDPAVGSRLLGLLASAQGALSGQDLADLIGISPLEVEEKLRSVVGRSMAPTRVDLLPLDAQLQAEVDAGLQMFVLAHTELQKVAVTALSRTTLAACTRQLHTWADGFRAEGWPEDTPNYLLTGYTRLVRESSDAGRLADLVLDPRRQLRLAERSGPDVALADLDFVAPSSSSPSLSTAARASASRELLVPHVRPLPGAVSRTIARLGDVHRARNLALASGSAAAKADNLAGVAHVLAAISNKQAAQTARDAAHWARTALTATGGHDYATDEAEAAAGHAALALLATEQERDGLVLLRSTRGSSTARNEAYAEAARMLPSHRPELLDDLEEQAETLAAEVLEGDGTGAVALELWATVAAADDTRVNRLYDRVLQHAHAVWEAAPTLANVAVLAATASFLSQARPQEATGLVSTACRHIASTVLGDVPLTAADAFHVEFDFRHTLAALARARDDVGAVGEEFDDVPARVEALLPSERTFPDASDDNDASEGERLADEAFRLADQGDDSEAERCLEQALALLPSAGTATGHAPVWLPDLADALVRAEAAGDLEALLELAQSPADRTRAHAAVALAYADTGQSAKAREHAREAALGAALRSAPNTHWPFAAQALAAAGDAEAALALIEQQRPPADRSRRAEWRKTDRSTRIAVAAELGHSHPQMSTDLLLPLLEQLHAGRTAPRSQGLLVRLAELLPAATYSLGRAEELTSEVKAEALNRMTRGGPPTWQPEEVLVHALLRIGDGHDPDRQLNWLELDMRHRGTIHFPVAALAVLHAARGDADAAESVAKQIPDQRRRAAALSAVACYFTRLPARPQPGADPTRTDPFTRSIQHLALTATPSASADRRTAAQFLSQALNSSGWYHGLPVLAQVEPMAISPVRDILLVHTRAALER
ncbi:hypothetical protein GCM10010095_80390 [Streptomyces anthocyanicus]|uniref:NACHT domain-containing protein n=1 Tax=Streptomyces violaceolatus TaxID=67378 RepID=A0ABN3THI8_9ACTN|nr:hypothetical protein GCM10010095_80390 [Streptomyces anthocyanicus]